MSSKAPAAWVVHKFGGTSVYDAQCFTKVADIIEAQPGRRVAVVLSAAKGVTDVLLGLVDLAERQDPAVASQLQALRERHRVIAEALLPVRDSLELALRSDAPSVENIREGVETTLRLLETVFERNKLVEIDPAGQKFDPNVHQAISTVPGNSVHPPAAPSHVVTVLQKGYLINDRVLRPALVTVAQA